MDMYCEKENCYEVLGLDSQASRTEIKRAYRQLALKHHPDKTKSKASAEIYLAAANAYEILSDKDTRAEYDYYLAHPEEHLYNSFRYYRSVSKKVPFTPVIAIFLLVLTAIKHGSRWYQYQRMVAAWRRYEPTRKRARKEALEKLGPPPKGRKGQKGHPKSVIEAAMKSWMDDMVHSGKLKIMGGYSKPTWRDLLIIQILFLPWNCFRGYRERAAFNQ